jgi:simple sugar transport system ATP-binding protein
MNRVEPQMIKNMPTELHAMESNGKKLLRVKESAMSFGEVSVRLQNITKRFPGGVIANQGITCEARRGEIHAILGENGAGKTTLMKILAGFHTPNSGQIEIDGQEVVFHSPKDAKLAGIGMVHQHFSLVPALTVGENLALGSPDTPFFLKPKRWNQHLMDSARGLGFDIRPDANVSQLSMGERQRVEIFRLLLEGARVLVLDEPTSILAPKEAERLFTHLREFAESGHTVFLVTHKIDHVKAIADKVTVLRRGQVVTTQEATELSEADLAELMVGHPFELSAPERPNKNDVSENEIALEVQELTVAPISCPAGMTDVSFNLRAGEILGVAGISSNGQDELVAALTGTAKFDGAIHLPQTQDHRMGFIPADRRGVGVALPLTVEENLNLRDFRRDGFSFGPLLNKPRLKSEARKKIERFGIQPTDPNIKTSVLSGGNIQKILLARELANQPDLILAVNPTAGLDIATVDFVHREITRQADEGASVLLVSEDLDELLGLCDRILVLFAGHIVGTFDADLEARNRIGLAMSGLGAFPKQDTLQEDMEFSECNQVVT